MRKRIQIWEKDEYCYPGAEGFVPFMIADIHDDEEMHPAMLVIPGGGFIQISSGETDGVAKEYYDLGYNTFVLIYTNNVTLKYPVFRQALSDAFRAVQLLRKNCREYHIDSDKIVGIGFSAGGFLTACLATLYDNPEFGSDNELPGVSKRLDAAVLVYALVSCGEQSESGTKQILFENPVKEFSLPKYVKETSVPMFILHGTADMMVPSDNAFQMAYACAEHNVPYELHILLGCNHGFVVENQTDKAVAQANYVFEQLYDAITNMTEEERLDYGDMYSDINKDMDYEAFSAAAQQITMTKMWMNGLQAEFENVEKAVRSTTSGNIQYAKQNNETRMQWVSLVNNWVKMLQD
ncbi:MAG: alpha/beta hydrolase [Eubacteriales bacterium]|nr:alpha/beta hydrolase [Eubacteriales bacterium]